MTRWRQSACTTFACVLIMFSTAPAPVRAQGESELANTTDDTTAATVLDSPVPAASAPPTDLRIPVERTQPERADAAPIPDKSDAAREPAELEHYDPWEAFNSKAFEFNRRMDTYALKPVAKVWKTVVPAPAGQRARTQLRALRGLRR